MKLTHDTNNRSCRKDESKQLQVNFKEPVCYPSAPDTTLDDMFYRVNYDPRKVFYFSSLKRSNCSSAWLRNII